jgi:hypothetical protein
MSKSISKRRFVRVRKSRLARMWRWRCYACEAGYGSYYKSWSHAYDAANRHARTSLHFSLGCRRLLREVLHGERD